MATSELIIGAVKGALVILFFLILMFGFYKILSMLGVLKLFKMFKKEKEINEEVYIKVGLLIEEGGLNSVAEYISKFPKPLQDEYIQAYLDIREVQNNGATNKK